MRLRKHRSLLGEPGQFSRAMKPNRGELKGPSETSRNEKKRSNGGLRKHSGIRSNETRRNRGGRRTEKAQRSGYNLDMVQNKRIEGTKRNQPERDERELEDGESFPVCTRDNLIAANI